MSEKQAKIAYLSIGSNLGDKKRNIELAKFILKKNNISIIKSSKNYETLSWPNKKNPKFINIVLKIKTNLNPMDLMEKCLFIEKQMGRFRTKKNAPRIIDIDIIDYDKRKISVLKKHNLVIPHPKMHQRNFVLLPLFEIAKNWYHPIKKLTINKLIYSLKNNQLISIKII